MFSLLIVLFVRPAPASSLLERLGCPYLFESLVPQFDVPNFIVPVSVPHDNVITTPIWHRRSTFERAFTMKTEISKFNALTQVTPEELIHFEVAHKLGHRSPRLRREMTGFVAWSYGLELDATIDAAISPTAVLHELRGQLPNSVRHLDRLSVYFYSPEGVPPTWEMVAEARGALLLAWHSLRDRGIPDDVALEVHTLGPLPEDPSLFVDFGIDVRGIPRR